MAQSSNSPPQNPHRHRAAYNYCVVCGDIWPCRQATYATRAGLNNGFTSPPPDVVRHWMVSDDDVDNLISIARFNLLEECAVIADQHACGDLANIFRRMKVRA